MRCLLRMLKRRVRSVPLLLISLSLAVVGAAGAVDGDLDGVDDVSDNCTLDANPTQNDGDRDGFGNVCDGDLNNDNVVNFVDLAALKQSFFQASPIADLSGDGVVNFADLALLKKGFFKAPGPAGPNPVGGSLLKGPLAVQSHSGKCLTYGTAPPDGTAPQLTDGMPVTLATCERFEAGSGLPVKLQHLGVEEITAALRNQQYAVILRAGDKVIGVAGNALIAQAPLELQSIPKGGAASAGQVFRLDGDSILLGLDRHLVVEPENSRGADGTRLVLGQRDVDDTEFWTFVTPAGHPVPPTSGFVKVRNAQELAKALGNGRRGTVVEVDTDRIDLSARLYNGSLEIPSGVTLRGDRRGTRFGPELFADFPVNSEITGSMLSIVGDDTRITGLRLRGPTRDVDAKPGYYDGVSIRYGEYAAIIDHNDISDWTVAGVNVGGIDDSKLCPRDASGQFLYRIDPVTRQQKLRILRNFIHHNRNYNGKGYGVAVGSGGYASIDGNIFLDNRHSLAGDGTTYSGYSAWFNLVLSHATRIDNDNFQQDFDMHGSDGGYGFPAGTGIEVIRNTFLGTNRNNLYLRGEPCSDPNQFTGNIVRQSSPYQAIKWWEDGDESHQSPEPFPEWITGEGNAFGAANPTNRLPVGDFDGDEVDDLFLATGAGWYFAPGANAEWRYVNARTEGAGSLLFGDFDGDGRTDVLHGVDGVWLVSWGGASRQWDYLNDMRSSLADTAIGDFDGDGHSDLFYADGEEWYVSSSGTGPFWSYANSSYRVRELRFGDFDGDHKTDVFGIVAGQWMVVYGGTETWAPLRSALTSSVDGLVVADFDGDGRADVATSIALGSGGYVWAASKGGTGAFAALRTSGVALHQAVGVGRFDDTPGADVLLWNEDRLDLSRSGSGTPARQSRQDMR